MFMKIKKMIIPIIWILTVVSIFVIEKRTADFIFPAVRTRDIVLLLLAMLPVFVYLLLVKGIIKYRKRKKITSVIVKSLLVILLVFSITISVFSISLLPEGFCSKTNSLKNYNITETYKIDINMKQISENVTFQNITPKLIPHNAEKKRYEYNYYSNGYHLYATWILPDEEYDKEKSRIDNEWGYSSKGAKMNKKSSTMFYYSGGDDSFVAVMFFDDEKRVTYLHAQMAYYLNINKTLEKGKPVKRLFYL